ncbi:MAG: PQQ-binding-like beta-propeller repeat protein [Fimbriimonadaceae bacterium]|nr:PQQ-binding-like beta-propeller repeat protein [Chitinophagales bacterium]
MKTIFLFTLTSLFFFVNDNPQHFLASGIHSEVPADSIQKAADKNDSIDVLTEVNEINNDSRFFIPKTFRSGHVEKTTYDNYLTKTDYGYIIKLPASNGVPTPAWFNEKLYISGGFGSKQFYSFEAETGELNWAINLDDDGPSSPIIEDSILIFNTESCTIFAVNIHTGKELWSYWLGDPLMSAPTSANGIVFTTYPAAVQNNTGDPALYNLAAKYSHVVIAFDLHSGKILWQKRIDGDALSSPVANDSTLHLVTLSGTYYTMQQRTGDFISAKHFRATSAPVFADGKAYMSLRADKNGESVSEQFSIIDMRNISLDTSYAKKEAPYLDAQVQDRSQLKAGAMSDDAGNGFSSGAPVTSGYMKASENIGQSNVSTLQNFYGSRLLFINGINYSTMGDELMSMDAETGRENWKFKISGDINESGGYLATAPIKAGAYLLIATLNGEIILINSVTGEEVKKYMINEPVRTQAIAMNGWIYVTTTTGKLVAINTNDITITGWPMLGGDNERSNNPS